MDGVCLLFNRRMPLVEYEPPVVEGFQQEYGLDPRGLPADDARWLAYRARTLTGFMRELRAALDDLRPAKVRNASISARWWRPPSKRTCRTASTFGRG